MSNQVIPKCPSSTCESTNFNVEFNRYVADTTGEAIQFVFCAECGTTVGVLPYKDKKLGK